MKKQFFRLFSVLLCLCAVLYSCETDPIIVNDTTVNDPSDNDSLAGNSYAWKQGFPYNGVSNVGGWLSDDVLSSAYDTLIHTMEVQFVGNRQGTIVETLETHYSSAYRYVAVTDTDDLARIPFYYPENWQQFDTVYSHTTFDTVDFHYTGNYPSITIKLNSNIFNFYSGVRPDFDYKFFGWDSSLDHTGEFTAQDTLVCKFLYKWDNEVDTVTRIFIKKL